MPRAAILAAALVASTLLAGCGTPCIEGPPITARGIASGVASGGSGGARIDLVVTDGPGGPPLPGAGVVFYWSSATPGDFNGPMVEVTPGRVAIDPAVANDRKTVAADSVLSLVTGPDGAVHAQLPSGRVVGIVSAKAGYTEEWVPALAPSETAVVAVELPLFRESISLDIEGVWPAPGAASPGTATSGDYAWEPQPIPFAESDAGKRGYAARIVEMRVVLNWSNGPTGAGDLAIGLGHEPSGPSYFRDNENNVAPGAHSEEQRVMLPELVDHGLLGAPALLAGPASDSGVATAFGLPYSIHVDAIFDRARAIRGGCGGSGNVNDNDGIPGAGALVAVGALAVAAVALGARRQ